jgi:hypothetical protein
MPTNRRPRVAQPRPPEVRITPKAIALFRELDSLECTCPEIDWDGEHWRHERCGGCQRRAEVHDQLINELGLAPTKPWEGLQIMRPDAVCPYPPDHILAPRWEPDRQGQALYRLLRRAAREQRRKRVSGRPKAPPAPAGS